MPKFHQTTILFENDSKLIAYALRKWARSGERPVVLFLHGALRNSGVLVDWAERLDAVADAVFFDLPGFGQSDPIGEASVAGMAECVFTAIKAAFPGRPVLIVGESLGGTVALAVGGLAGHTPVKAVFAADPPMTTGKLWSVARAHWAAMAQSESDTFIYRFADKVFGLTDSGVEERIYYPLLGRLRVPAVIGRGDVALFPAGRANGNITLFDDVDVFVLENFYAEKAQIEQIENCGHLMLTEAIDPCRAIIDRLLATHLAPATVSP
jgi:pimeloyl-ACP methyl ester carboxylesterase